MLKARLSLSIITHKLPKSQIIYIPPPSINGRPCIDGCWQAPDWQRKQDCGATHTVRNVCKTSCIGTRSKIGCKWSLLPLLLQWLTDVDMRAGMVPMQSHHVDSTILQICPTHLCPSACCSVLGTYSRKTRPAQTYMNAHRRTG